MTPTAPLIKHRQSGDKSYSGRYLTLYLPGSYAPSDLHTHGHHDWVETGYAQFGGDYHALLLALDNSQQLRVFIAPNID